MCLNYSVVILPFWFDWFIGGEVNLLNLRVIPEIKIKNPNLFPKNPLVSTFGLLETVENGS